MLDRLEAKFGRWAIEGLIGYVVAAQAVSYILNQIFPGFAMAMVLDRKLVWAGEFWRCLTFLFYPPDTSPIWVIFALYLLYLYGSGLERAWGAFRFTLYYFLGALGTVLGALFIVSGPVTNVYLNLSIFFAFAMVLPNFELLLFFILPVKIKYLAMLGSVPIFLGLYRGSWGIRIAILASLANFLIFFGPEIIGRLRRQKPAVLKKMKTELAFHSCASCETTEIKDGDAVFRFCDKCEKEFCSQHLETHSHDPK